MERKLAQLRCDAVVLSVGTLKSAIDVIRWHRYGSFAFFCCHPLHHGYDFIRRQHPIHRN